MSYIPNFKDPRVLRRIIRAYGFARAVLTNTPRSWSTRYIDQYFGQQQHPLSRWLRKQLLIVTHDHWSKDTGQCKYYILNSKAADLIRNKIRNPDQEHIDWISAHAGSGLELEQDLKFDQQVVAKFVVDEWGQELALKKFEYKDIKSRYWHPLQNLRNEYRHQLFANYGLKYQYDIECCAPTLIHQHAQQQQEPMDLYLFALREYLRDRHQVRQCISEGLEIDIKTAKILINSLFCGARIGHGSRYAISQLLEHDLSRILWIKQNPYIQELISDIRTCWEYIKPSMIKKYNQQGRRIPTNSREKWLRYFDLERTCMNSVQKYMKSTNNHYFLEHDGWTCEREIDLLVLEQQVFIDTGFSVKFEQKYTESNREKLVLYRSRLDSLICSS